MGPQDCKSTERFSNRVENYLRYRPHYPREVIDLLKADCALKPEHIVADVGSGTGFLAELFLANGNRVFAIEPNKEMREAGERLLQKHTGFASIAGTAEEMTLAGQSVDFITAGQAFHWFDRERCREEFVRVLRPGGWVVLVWNDRRTDTTPFLMGYERLLLSYATDYEKVNHKRVDAAVLREFFRVEPIKKIIPTHQHLDYAALKGRLLSSSYVPEAGQPHYDEMLVALKTLFAAQQQAGQVTFDYDTLLYYARLH